MVSLPPVEETFEANVAPYVAGLDAMVAAAERARDANYELIASMEMVAEAEAAAARSAGALDVIQRDVADASADLMRQTAMLGSILQALEIIQKNTADSSADLMMQTQLLAGAERAEADAASQAAKNEYLLAMAQRLRAKATDDAAAATTRGTMAFGRWGLTWNALHWIIAGGAELLAVTLPAAVAAAAGAFVLYQGVVEQLEPRMQALYTTTEATGAMMHQTAGDVLGLGHAFQSAQNAANPVAFQLLGEYLLGAKTQAGGLATAGYEVARAVGAFGAKIDTDLLANKGEIQGLLSNMVQDLIEIGQVFGNVGHAVLNFAAAMPGLAEVLLRIVDGASQVVLWVSKLPPVLITTFMVFEEASRWGGGLVTMLGRLGLATSELGGSFFSAQRYLGIFSNVLKAIPMLAATVISNIGSLLTGFGRFGGPLGQAGTAMRNFGADMTDAIVGLSPGMVGAIGIAAAAFAFLVVKTWDARGATESWIASMNQAVSASSNLNVINVIANGLAATQTRLAASQQNVAKASVDTANSMGTAGRFAQSYALSTSYAVQANRELSAEQQHLTQQMHNVFAGAGAISKQFGGSYTEALGIADIAGVKLANTTVQFGKNLNQAGAQIEAVVLGYQKMDQVGGILGNDMNAVAAAAGLQNTKVSQLNQAWDQFLSNATALTGGFAGLTTDIGQINNAITSSGTAFQTFGGKAVSSTQAAALALKSFGGVGAQVWTNYNAALQQAQQYTDSLRIAATTGAVGQKAYTQQIAYTVQQLLPYAKYSQAAAAELGVLVQQAGGPAVTSYKQLKDWVDQNTESTKQFMKQMTGETVAMSDATKVAESYASTLDSSVAAAMQAATISSAQLTQKTEGLNNAWAQAHDTVSGPVVGAFRGLVESLTQVYGNTNTAIKVADAYMRQQGATAAQVANLNRQIASTVAWLSRIHSPPPVTITVNGQITGSGAAAIAALGGYGGGGEGGVGHRVAYQTGAQYASAGVALVGEQGPELVRFGGGEQVLPSWQTAPILRGGAPGGGSDTINLQTHNEVSIAGTKVQSVQRTQILTYQRRNPSNNWALRTR